MTDFTPARAWTAVDDYADEFLAASAELDPVLATSVGLPGYDHLLPDLSPDGVAARAELSRRTLAGVASLTPTDETDRVTLAALAERLGVSVELDELEVPLSELNNISSPVQSLRGCFDLMPAKTEQDWATIARRMAAVPEAIRGYLASLRLAASRGAVAPARQVRACIAQSEANLGPAGFFAGLLARAEAAAGPLPATLRTELEAGCGAAQDGYRQLRDFLGEQLLDRAPESDACGRQRYAVLSRRFLGAALDLAEAYDWGQAELARIHGLMRETADRIRPGASVEEAVAILDSDPTRRLSGTDALQAWMQQRADAAIAALADTHFDIPQPLRRLECLVAPTHTGVIYYTNPSDDFSRPGRMWWSVPERVDTFSTWRELTTVYHEGVPGHHLQIGQAVYNRAQLNSWRRLASWTSGHGEGWALYAEWLMSDLGYLDEPGERLGLLDGQSMRAARVVIDIGVHCRLPAPAEVGGGEWNYDKAWQLLSRHCHMSEAFRRFELERYLGWPGQAPAYKLGERQWLQLREEVRRREGAGFDLKQFHRRTLGLGNLGLDVLRQAVLGQL